MRKIVSILVLLFCFSSVFSERYFIHYANERTHCREVSVKEFTEVLEKFGIECKPMIKGIVNGHDSEKELVLWARVGQARFYITKD